ncbi:hypothetical protein KSS87_018014 [Heliosperma pusillum]|nr:hypothetical protein KSS87_018014 [Heliosperma pusillum]
MAAVFVYVNSIFPPLKHSIIKLPFPHQIQPSSPTVRLLNPYRNQTAVKALTAGGESIMWPKLNRKLVHISIGLAFMLCWPLFSSGSRGAVLASLIPGVNILRMLVIGLGLQKDEATVTSMSRFGDHRELLKGPMYYAATITFACVYYWRTSPIGIGAICNLCAGDGLADIVGRRFGKHKLPYNQEKSFAGSIAMLIAGFLTSVAFMLYFSQFGFIPVSWDLVTGFFFYSSDVYLQLFRSLMLNKYEYVVVFALFD